MVAQKSLVAALLNRDQRLAIVLVGWPPAFFEGDTMGTDVSFRIRIFPGPHTLDLPAVYREHKLSVRCEYAKNFLLSVLSRHYIYTWTLYRGVVDEEEQAVFSVETCQGVRDDLFFLLLLF